MLTTLRASMMFALLAVLAVAPAVALGAASQSPPEPVAVEIRGDTVSRLAGSSPEATAQIVLGAATYARDAGGGWQASGQEPPPGIATFAADDPDLILVGDHAPCLRGGAGSSLERSEDGGTTWEPVSNAGDLRPLAVWAGRGVALGATCAGMMLSTDAGLTWSDLAAVEAGYEITAFATASPPSADAGPVVIFGMTSEGGTSRLYRLDLTDPAAPALSEPLREYWGVAGLAAREETYVLAAADGVAVSDDAGTTWERSRDGLEDVTLDADPAQAGLPVGVEPGSFGLYAAAYLGTEGDALLVGSADGLYLAESTAGPWSRIEGTAGEVRQIGVSADGALVLYVADETVYELAVAAGGNSGEDGASPGLVEPAREATAQTRPPSG